MLSYIYRICMDFEKSHGIRPTLLYLNQRHFARLMDQLAGEPSVDAVIARLGMDIVLSDETVHPHVSARQAKVRYMQA